MERACSRGISDEEDGCGDLRSSSRCRAQAEGKGIGKGGLCGSKQRNAGAVGQHRRHHLVISCLGSASSLLSRLPTGVGMPSIGAILMLQEYTLGFHLIRRKIICRFVSLF